jgi:hypothetical protein
MQWHEPVAGFEYLPATVTISAADQTEKLAACGLSSSLYGARVDPSFFIGEAIHAGINSGISAQGNVNMLQTLTQHRPAGLGEPLQVHGRITAVEPVPRGRTVDTEVVFESASGERVITANRRSLKPDPEQPGLRGAGERPAPVVRDLSSLEILSEHILTPDQVIAYSREGNSIHYDLEAAQAAGFRAPLIGGGMGVHYLLAALMAKSAPEYLDLDIYFRRPIFWDDAFCVMISPAADAICIAKHPHAEDAHDELKVATEARIKSPL